MEELLEIFPPARADTAPENCQYRPSRFEDRPAIQRLEYALNRAGGPDPDREPTCTSSSYKIYHKNNWYVYK